MPRAARFALLALSPFSPPPPRRLTPPTQMPIGFFDDPTFRWSPNRARESRARRTTGASVIHTTANWATIAPTKPANAANGDDPAYKIGDLDDLVFQAGLYGLRVMIDINGTPKWANGGKSPNVMPKKLSDLTTFAQDARDAVQRPSGSRVGVALVGVERAEPPALPDPAVRRQEDRRPGELRRSSSRPRTPASSRATRSRRSRSARRPRVAATSRSPA